MMYALEGMIITLPSWIQTSMAIDSVAKRYSISITEVREMTLKDITFALTMNELEANVQKREQQKNKNRRMK